MNIVIVGGGTAGWLTAALIAAKHQGEIKERKLTLTLIESRHTPTLGVGEGTWPSMKATLKTIGLSETAFLLYCNASFKQGSTFINWVKGNDRYHHPFSPPDRSPGQQNHSQPTEVTAQCASQTDLIRHHIAPKLLAAGDYEGTMNYGYHLDADKFVSLLKVHCTSKLGVKHQYRNITTAQKDKAGNITHVVSENGEAFSGDLFIDCSGARALLLQGLFNIDTVNVSHVLPNNCALACRLPYKTHDAPIHSSTRATATPHGWIWDIALQHRRGIGHVFSTDFASKDKVENQLFDYVRQDPHLDESHFETREIRFTPGYRAQFWHKNCVAVGMAAGFIEPLEATALALVEQSALFISAHLTTEPAIVKSIAHRFNRLMTHYWHEIIDFLKLHYTLSMRDDSDYWRSVSSCDNLPQTLKEKLLLWQALPASVYDTEMKTPLFSHNSFHYVLTGARQYQVANGNDICDPPINNHLVRALPTQQHYFQQLRLANNKKAT